MNTIIKKSIALAMAAGFAVTASACGSDEPAQTAAGSTTPAAEQPISEDRGEETLGRSVWVGKHDKYHIDMLVTDETDGSTAFLEIDKDNTDCAKQAQLIKVLTDPDNAFTEDFFDRFHYQSGDPLARLKFHPNSNVETGTFDHAASTMVMQPYDGGKNTMYRVSYVNDQMTFTSPTSPEDGQVMLKFLAGNDLANYTDYCTKNLTTTQD